MQTNEFIKEVERLGFKINEIDGTFFITEAETVGLFTVATATVSKDHYGTMTLSTNDVDLINVIVEYATTLVNQREPEKEFRLKVKEDLKWSANYSYLTLNRNTHTIFNGHPREINNEYFQQAFTESEMKEVFDNVQRAWIEQTYDKEWIDK